MTGRLEDLLTDWIARQRWFAGKGRAIDRLEIAADTELVAGDPGLRHLILAVRQGTATDRYQLLLGLRADPAGLPDRSGPGVIGRCTGPASGAAAGRYVYDAVHDPALTRRLLEYLATGADRNGLRFRRLPGAEIDPGPRGTVLGAEQSNTSLVYGESYICKIFRRLTPGLNPELEIVSALARRDVPHIARPYGWIEAEVDGTATTLAILQEYLPAARDGWALALASVRDFYAAPPAVPASRAGGDFAAEAYRLGEATARIHRELALAFPTGVLPPEELKRLADRLRRRLAETAAEIPELRPHAAVARRAFDRLAEVARPVPVQRVHGDYHLGQVMRTPTEWIILDFEGEPGQPLAERRALDSPLRDVAGMLRSFEYAPRHLLLDAPDAAALEAKAAAWARRNRDAFLDGYRAGGGGVTGDDAVLLRALEFAKAVYEVRYEARNRPAWLPIPLAAFR